jgi:molybdopterin converting factor small subunit
MRVDVRLFALARERAGAATLAVEVPEGATVADLKGALARTCPALEPVLAVSVIAVNSTYTWGPELVPPDADLAIIPPVSGGSSGASSL